VITAGHVVISSRDAEADRTFFRDVLGFGSVDAGDGWLIFALPPSEAAFHPSDQNNIHEFYLMCDDLEVTMNELAKHDVTFGATLETSWGVRTTLQLPGGGELGLYQPKHPMAVSS
jgi:catechol 2,3-dioxygenase-like lactoylglutathione lyase family enzyme